MKFDPQNHHRRSIRLKGYDYSQAGAYFITVVAWRRECLFGEICDGEMRLNEFGVMIAQAWFDLPNHYANVELGAFCVMPNHVHGVIVLNGGGVGAGLRPAPTGPAPTGPIHTGPAPTGPRPTPPASPIKNHPLSEIVRAFKSFSARRINEARQAKGLSVWQRNYYERIIRSDEEHQHIHRYIEANPGNWIKDDHFPENA